MLKTYILLAFFISILFTINSQSCKDSNCLSCSSSSCTRCKNGFSLNNKGGCWQCPYDCAECLHSSAYCSTCEPGFTLNSNIF